MAPPRVLRLKTASTIEGKGGVPSVGHIKSIARRARQQAQATNDGGKKKRLPLPGSLRGGSDAGSDQKGLGASLPSGCLVYANFGRPERG